MITKLIRFQYNLNINCWVFLLQIRADADAQTAYIRSNISLLNFDIPLQAYASYRIVWTWVCLLLVINRLLQVRPHLATHLLSTLDSIINTMYLCGSGESSDMVIEVSHSICNVIYVITDSDCLSIYLPTWP